MAGPAAASGAVRHATVSGSGTTCSEADPCDVQTAVESASATDQVVVHPGTYTSNNDPLEVPDDVSVGSVAGQSRPRLVFTGSADAVTLGNGSSIARMAIESDGSGSALVGAPLSGGGTAERLIVHSTGDTACTPRNTLLRDSVCWSSGDGGFAIRAASDTNAQTVTLRNVTADATSVDGTGLQVSAITGGSITVNAVNVIVDGGLRDVETTTDSSGSSANVNFTNSNVVNLFAGGTDAANHFVGPDNQTTTKPTFVDKPNGDFHQQSTSITIDAGVDNGDLGTKDIDGNDRQVGLGPDIGADEYAEPFARVIGNVSPYAGVQGAPAGSADGPVASATFHWITGLAEGPGVLYTSELKDNGLSPADGWVRKIDLATGTVSTVIPQTTFAPVSITYANDVLYIADPNGSIKKVDLSAVTPTLTDFATGLAQPEAVTTDGTNLYVTDNGCGPTVTESKILVYPIADNGTTHTTLATFPKPDQPEGCATLNEIDYADGYVYAADRYQLYKVDTLTGAATTLISGFTMNFPRGIDVVGGLLYITPAMAGVEMWAVDPQTGRYSPNFAGSRCGAGIDCYDRTQGPHMGLGVDAGWSPNAIADVGGTLYVADQMEDGGTAPSGSPQLIRKVQVLSDETPPDGSATAGAVVDAVTAADGTAPLAETDAATLPPASARLVHAAAAEGVKTQLSLTAADTGGGQTGVRWFQVRSGGQTSSWLPVIANPSVEIFGGAGEIRFADRSSNVSAWKAISFPATGGGNGGGVPTTQTPSGTPITPPPGGTSVADKTAPVLTIGWKAKQKLGKFLVVTVTCRSEPCTAKAAATVRVKRGKKTKKFVLRPVSRKLARGKAVTLKLAIPASLRKAGAAALKARGKLSVALILTATDAAGNKATVKRTGTLKR